MAGTLVLTDTIGRTFDDLFAERQRRHRRRASAATERSRAPFGSEPAAAVDATPRRHGRAPSTAWPPPRARRRATPRSSDADGKAIGNPAGRARRSGATGSTSRELNPFRARRGQRPRGADDEVVIDRHSADEGRLRRRRHRHRAGRKGRRSGCGSSASPKFGDADSPGGASFVAVHQRGRAAARRRAGQVRRRSPSSPPTACQAELRERHRRRRCPPTSRPSPARSSPRRTRTPSQGASASSTRSCWSSPSSPCSSASSSSTTPSRSSSPSAPGRWRCCGRSAPAAARCSARCCSRRGRRAARSLLGLVAGIGVAAGLKALLAGFGIDIPAGGLVFTAAHGRHVAASSGVGVTLVSAFFPARKAGEGAADGGHARRRGPSTGSAPGGATIVGAVVTALGVARRCSTACSARPANALAIVGLGASSSSSASRSSARSIARPLSRLHRRAPRPAAGRDRPTWPARTPCATPSAPPPPPPRS